MMIFGDDSFVDYDLLIVWMWKLDNAKGSELVNILYDGENCII